MSVSVSDVDLQTFVLAMHLVLMQSPVYVYVCIRRNRKVKFPRTPDLTYSSVRFFLRALAGDLDENTFPYRQTQLDVCPSRDRMWGIAANASA